MNKNIISLFTGAGGLDLGFKNAGFNTVWANEFDNKIHETFKLNFENTVLNTDDISKVIVDKIPDCVGIIGGPPCQSFSEAGAGRGTKDPRGQLFWDYVRILKSKKPMFFVAENVSGLLSNRHKKDLESFLLAFDNAGYEVDYKLYRASNYGVPQDRERLIMVGYRKDLNKSFSGIEEISVKRTLKDAIGDLGEPTPSKNGTTNNRLDNHEYMTGGFSSMFMSRNRVRSWDEQSFTILATARQTPLHPQAPKMVKIHKDKYEFVLGKTEKYRRFSVREAARIQTFPDNFKLKYDKIEDGYKMIGNAVPVLLAEQIAKAIIKDLF